MQDDAAHPAAEADAPAPRADDDVGVAASAQDDAMAAVETAEAAPCDAPDEAAAIEDDARAAPPADTNADADPAQAAEATADDAAASPAEDVDDAPASDAVPAFALPERLRLEETEALLDHLRAAPAEAPLALDARAVSALSTPAVLALAAAARARAEAGVPLAVENPSAAFVDAFSDLGLFQDLMKMEFRA